MKNLSLSNYKKSQTSDIRIFKSPTNETIHVVNGKLESSQIFLIRSIKSNIDSFNG